MNDKLKKQKEKKRKLFNLKKDQREEITGYTFLIPIIVLFSFIIFIPAGKAFLDSFTNSGLYQQIPKFIGLKNYIELFKDVEFWKTTARTVFLVTLVVGLQYILGLILAMLLNLELKGTRWMKNFIMIPWVIPVASMVVMFDFMVIPKFGLVNMILKNIGLNGFTRYWFGDKMFAFPLIIIMHIWRNMPFYAITLYAALKGISATLYEAADIDGANAWDKFWNITLPQIKTPSMIVIILHILFTVNNFDIIYLATGGGPVGKTEVLATQVYQMSWTNYEYGKASAMGIFMMLIMIVVSIVSMRQSNEA